MRQSLRLVAGVILWLTSGCLWAVDDVSLYALFQGKAIVLVNGKQHLLNAGEVSPEGVKLISTDTGSNEAVVDVGGKREVLKLGVIISRYQSASEPTVTVYAGAGGVFHTDGSINGFPVTFLVDTGANIVALNVALARKIGLDYSDGQPGVAKTASGYVRDYNVELDSVRIGGIVMRNVDASIIDGPQPDTPLLGMSFLSNLEMRRDGDKMELTQKY
ncbi:MAG: retropepsin-like aspartic protease family protein [Acidiferrobacterales bacterium]